MTSLKRTVASLQGWWTRLFLLGIVLALVLDVPFWIDLPSLAVLLTLSLVRAPRRDDHPPVAVACPSPGAGPHSTLPPTRCRVTAYGLMAKRSRSTSPTRAPRTLHADQLGPAAT